MRLGCEIRERIGSDYIKYKENEFAQNTSDFYELLGLFLEYDINDKCNSISFDKGTAVDYEGVDLMGLSYSRLREIFDMKSVKKEEEEEIGITYMDLGFGVNKVFNSDEIQTLIIFSVNYWE